MDVPDNVAKQLLSRAPGGSTNFLRAAIDDTLIISMKGVRYPPPLIPSPPPPCARVELLFFLFVRSRLASTKGLSCSVSGVRHALAEEWGSVV